MMLIFRGYIAAIIIQWSTSVHGEIPQDSGDR